MKKLRLAGIANYEQANAFLEKRYLAEHNRRYAHAAASADYHRRRPTTRQLDEVFWLEEERGVSEDWVVRYNNRLLQLERQSRHWAPVRSRVWVRENEAGEVVSFEPSSRLRSAFYIGHNGEKVAYPAHKGWDFTTALGSVNVHKLDEELALRRFFAGNAKLKNYFLSRAVTSV